MKAAFILLSALYIAPSAHAACMDDLECKSGDKAVVFIHGGSEGGLPYTDDSTLELFGKKTELRGTSVNENDESVPGDYFWTESDSFGTKVYTLAPTKGNGAAMITVTENKGSRSRVVTKIKSFIQTEKYSFRGKLTLRSGSGTKFSSCLRDTEISVVCKASTACD